MPAPSCRPSATVAVVDRIADQIALYVGRPKSTPHVSTPMPAGWSAFAAFDAGRDLPPQIENPVQRTVDRRQRIGKTGAVLPAEALTIKMDAIAPDSAPDRRPTQFCLPLLASLCQYSLLVMADRLHELVCDGRVLLCAIKRPTAPGNIFNSSKQGQPCGQSPATSGSRKVSIGSNSAVHEQCALGRCACR